jgi:hypothetical protein
MKVWLSEELSSKDLWIFKHWLKIAVILGVLIFGLLAFFVCREIKANWNYYTAVYGELFLMLAMWACMMALAPFGILLAYWGEPSFKSSWIPIQKYGSFRK